MLRQRTALGAASGNSAKKPQLSPYMRGKIVGQATTGVKVGGIAKALKVDRNTINYTLLQDDLRDQGNTIPKAPRKRTYTPAEERKLLRHVREFPKDSYEDVIKACNLGCKTSTIKKILAKHNIRNCPARKRPKLTKEHAAKRLQWCLDHRGWTVEEWGLIACPLLLLVPPRQDSLPQRQNNSERDPTLQDIGSLARGKIRPKSMKSHDGFLPSNS